MDTFFEILGWVGAAFLLFAFYLNSSGKITADTFAYQFMNLIAALFLVINAYWIDSFPFMIINGFWLAISVISLFKMFRKNRM